MCVHMCVCVCLCVYTCVCLCVYLFGLVSGFFQASAQMPPRGIYSDVTLPYVCTHVYVLCVYTCVHMCTHVCVYVCTHVCVYVCTYVCVYVCTDVCVYVCHIYVFMCVSFWFGSRLFPSFRSDAPQRHI